MESLSLQLTTLPFVLIDFSCGYIEPVDFFLRTDGSAIGASFLTKSERKLARQKHRWTLFGTTANIFFCRAVFLIRGCRLAVNDTLRSAISCAPMVQTLDNIEPLLTASTNTEFRSAGRFLQQTADQKNRSAEKYSPQCQMSTRVSAMRVFVQILFIYNINLVPMFE